jgi:hypothetical protein
MDFPVINHNGSNFHLVPEEALNRMTGEKIDRTWLAIGVCGITIAAITAAISSKLSAPAPMVVEKPVIVTQEKVVPTNCFAFCK